MTASNGAQLAELAEHYAKNLLTHWTTSGRKDALHPDDDEAPQFTAADVIESYQVLAEASPDYNGKTIQVENFVTIINDEGHEVWIPFDKVTAEHIDTAQACLAAQFDRLYAQSHLIMTTFAGLDRLRQQFAKEVAK